MKTQIAIIGAGPAGTLLSRLLRRASIENVVIEHRSRNYVLGRIRAGVLEGASVKTLQTAGAGERVEREGKHHDTINFAWGGENFLSTNTTELAGYPLVAYGQNSIQQDLYEAADRNDRAIHFEASNVKLHDVETSTPWVTFVHDGLEQEVRARFVIGCDSFHGISRTAIPRDVRTEYAKSYPFGWLGILVEAPPLSIIMYAQHERSFALCSMRVLN